MLELIEYTLVEESQVPARPHHERIIPSEMRLTIINTDLDSSAPCNLINNAALWDTWRSPYVNQSGRSIFNHRPAEAQVEFCRY